MKICHNSGTPTGHPARSCARTAFAPLCLYLALTGCQSPQQTFVHVEVAAWELEQARPVAPVFAGRARVSFDRPLPAHLLQKLSDVYTLVTIVDSRDWEQARKQLDLVDSRREFNYSQGSIIGILAAVGESAEPDWPIEITAARVSQGVGWIDVRFDPGLYYPLQTAWYLELVYVPGLRSVRYVQINDHRFRILRGTSEH